MCDTALDALLLPITDLMDWIRDSGSETGLKTITGAYAIITGVRARRSRAAVDHTARSADCDLFISMRIGMDDNNNNNRNSGRSNLSKPPRRRRTKLSLGVAGLPDLRIRLSDVLIKVRNI